MAAVYMEIEVHKYHVRAEPAHGPCACMCVKTCLCGLCLSQRARMVV